jgi:hypothetical protein
MLTDLCRPRDARSRKSGQGTAIAFLLFLPLFASALPGAKGASSPQMVIAVGDVHGDFDDFCSILKRAGLIDEQHHWTGGKTTFVQTGDLLDRGPKVREGMDLMEDLEKEAAKSDGHVVALLGNHEMMNLMGDLRYVTAQNYASFADAQSEKRREKAYHQYASWRAEHKELLAEAQGDLFETTESEWMNKHPLGFVEQRKAFSPDGGYGRWIRKHDAVVEINGVLFAHGGLAPDVVSLGIDEINARIHKEMEEFDEAKDYLESKQLILSFFTLEQMAAVVQAEFVAAEKPQPPSAELQWSKLTPFLRFGTWLSVRADGPLWFRGYDTWTDGEGRPLVDRILEAYKAEHIVAAHTVQRTGRIRSRFGGKVFLIDTGMLSSYWPGGRPSALEIRNHGSITAVYLDGQAVMLSGGDLQRVQ